MKFRCPCGEKEMNIADERLPATGTMRFPCPVCKKPIVLDPVQPHAPASFESTTPGAPVAAAGVPLASAQGGAQAAASLATGQAGRQGGGQPASTVLPEAPEESPALEPEMIPHGTKAALTAVTDPRWRQAAAVFFRDRGYYLIEETDPAVAVAKLLINAVDAALVEGSPLWQPVLDEITLRPGLKRRETCLIVTGNAKSMDSYAAFLLGADWVLHAEDVGRATELLGEMLARQEAAQEPWRLAETTQ